MSKRHSNSKGGGINIPGVILDQIKDYGDDERFSQPANGKKRGASTLGRKERRKQERSQKKHKPVNTHKASIYHNEKHKPQKSVPKSSVASPKKVLKSSLSNGNFNGDKPKKSVKFTKGYSESESNSSDYESMDEQSTWAALSKLKANSKSASSDSIRIVKEDDLEDDDMSSDSNNFEPEDEDDLDENATWAALKALKGNSKSTSSNNMRIVKEDDLDDDDDFSEEENEDSDDDLASNFMADMSDDDQEDSDRDENESANETDTWAALKALKGDRTKNTNTDVRIVKEDDLEEDESFGSEEDNEEDQDEEEYDDEEEKDTWAALKALKGNKSKKTSEIRIIKEDDLDDDSFSDASLAGSESEEEEQAPMKSTKSKKSKEEKYAPLPLTPQERELMKRDEDDMKYYAKKLGLKKGKGISKQGDDDIIGGLLDGLDFGFDESQEDESASEEEEKPSKKEKEKKKKKEQEEEVYAPRPLSARERELMKRDEEDMKYYAKKLGLKTGKSLSKQNDNDGLGSLLDGLDFDKDFEQEQMSDSDDEMEDQSSDEEDSRVSKSSRRQEKYNDSDDDINSSDFDSNDDDLDEDDKELLRQMGEMDDSEASEYSDEDDDDENENNGKPRVKENPFVAPVSDTNDANESTGGKYIPPALRRKMALEASGSEDQERLERIAKLCKGPLNRLSEPTVMTVVNELNALYNDNARQVVNEAILKVILESVLSPIKALDSLLVLYAALIVSIFRLQGVGFGAYVLQTIVEKLSVFFEEPSKVRGQEASNLIALLGNTYNFNLVGSKLIYDIISNKLLSDISEFKTDLLSRLIGSCGTKMRSDDADALKQIILELNKAIAAKEASTGVKTSTKTVVLVDTITKLKNNKSKSMESENTLQMFTRLRKQIGRINSSSQVDPIRVSLNDIESVEERGKWWLVGSAWKGQESKNDNPMSTEETETKSQKEQNKKSSEFEVNEEAVNDIIGSAEPNWIELARQQRMNTDIRRAIFVSIMSAEDYMDAMGKFEKLQLKRNQEREIPNIIIHCASMESLYNPYYGFLAKKLCEQHSMRKTFQFNLWDKLKEFEGEDKDEDELEIDTSNTGSDEGEKLKTILNLGRLFGFLIGEGSLPLNILHPVNFLTANSDTKLFVEILLITFLDCVAKISEEKSFGSGLHTKVKAKDMKFNDKFIIERIAKCKDQRVLLKGLQFFLQDKLKESDLIKGRKQKVRVDWGIDSMCDVIDSVLTEIR